MIILNLTIWSLKRVLHCLLPRKDERFGKPWWGLNSQHYDYKRVAQPTELSQHAAIILDQINLQHFTQLHARGFTATTNNNDH